MHVLSNKAHADYEYIPARVGLGNSTIVIHCCDNWSAMVMMIVLFYYHDSIRHDIE